MKKLRIIFSVLAIILAGTATFASMDGAVPGKWEYTPAVGPIPAQCNSISIDCGNFAGAPCVSTNGKQVRNDNDLTNCGTQLKFR